MIGLFEHDSISSGALASGCEAMRMVARDVPATLRWSSLFPGDSLSAQVDAAVAKLSKPCGLVLILCGLEGRSPAEAALLLQWPEETVRSLLEQAHGELRNALAASGTRIDSVRVLRKQLSSSCAPVALDPSFVAATSAAAVKAFRNPSREKETR